MTPLDLITCTFRVGVLDDVVVLDGNCLRNMKEYVASDNDVQGIGLVFLNISPRETNIYNSFSSSMLCMTELLFHRCFLIQYITMTKNLTLEWFHGGVGATFGYKKFLMKFPLTRSLLVEGILKISTLVSEFLKNKFIFAPMAKSFVYENFLALQN